MLFLCLTPCAIMSCAHSARPKRRASGMQTARRRRASGMQAARKRHENGALAARSGNPAARRRDSRPYQTNPMECEAGIPARRGSKPIGSPKPPAQATLTGVSIMESP